MTKSAKAEQATNALKIELSAALALNVPKSRRGRVT